MESVREDGTSLIIFMSTYSREILETLSHSDPESHPRLLTVLAVRLGFIDVPSQYNLDTSSISKSFLHSVESLERFLSENFENRVDWLSRWWCPNVLTEFVGVLFECM